MADDGTVYRTFRDGDEHEVLRLAAGTGAACTLDEWAWRFPIDELGRTIVVGEHDGEVTSVCAAVPVSVTIDGREHPGAEILKLVSAAAGGRSAVLEHFTDTFGADGRCAIVIASLRVGAEAPTGFSVVHAAPPATLVRARPKPSPPVRLRYRAEPARDWEPRLDGLWRRARGAYPVAVVRDADHALRRFAGHPTIRHHRFLVFPRFSSKAVAFAVFAVIDGRLNWLDMVWDHGHPGALDLLAHLSARLTNQLGADGEELRLGGDAPAAARLGRRGFELDPSRVPPRIAARSLSAGVDAARFVDGAYVTTADIEVPLP